MYYNIISNIDVLIVFVLYHVKLYLWTETL